VLDGQSRPSAIARAIGRHSADDMFDTPATSPGSSLPESKGTHRPSDTLGAGKPLGLRANHPAPSPARRRSPARAAYAIRI